MTEIVQIGLLPEPIKQYYRDLHRDEGKVNPPYKRTIAKASILTAYKVEGTLLQRYLIVHSEETTNKHLGVFATQWYEDINSSEGWKNHRSVCIYY